MRHRQLTGSREAETRGPRQGPLEPPDGSSRRSSRGDRKTTEPQDRAFRGAGPTRHGRGAGPDASGDRQHKGQQSERRCLTRRCSGLASLAAELHSLGRALEAWNLKWAQHVMAPSGLWRRPSRSLSSTHPDSTHVWHVMRRGFECHRRLKPRPTSYGIGLPSHLRRTIRLAIPWMRSPIEAHVLSTCSISTAKSVRGDLAAIEEPCPRTGRLPVLRARSVSQYEPRPGRENGRRVPARPMQGRPNPALQRTRFARR